MSWAAAALAGTRDWDLGVLNWAWRFELSPPVVALERDSSLSGSVNWKAEKTFHKQH